jgi:tripartite-type tricarboxylate transporter receptor subunit TctC
MTKPCLYLTLPLATLSLATPSFAAELSGGEKYPIRPIRMIVPYPPGGGNDVIARMLVQRLSETGIQSYVENLPGAGGTIGAGAAAKAPADGYTVAVVNQDFVIQPAVKATVPYSPFGSFAPVTMVATAPESISVHPSFPASNILELVAVLKSNPGKYGYASPGYGTSPHVASERLFKLTYGLDVTHVPFQGASPAITSTIAGHTAILPFGLYVIAPYVNDGKLRTLAVADSRRSPLLPDVPTLTEAGVQGNDYGFWVGMVAPAQTPGALIKQLNRQVAQVVSAPDMQARLAQLGFRPVASTPEEFNDQLKAEAAQWSGIVRDAGSRSIDPGGYAPLRIRDVST